MENYLKVALYVYPKLERIERDCEEHIRNKAFMSYDYRETTENLSVYLAEEILKKEKIETLRNTIDEALERLTEEEAKTGDLLDGAVPVTKQRRVVLTGDLMPERRIHPLAAVYRTSMREVLERKLRAGRYRLTDALAEARILYVNVSGNPQFVTMLQNINHISEYEALLSGEKGKN